MLHLDPILACTFQGISSISIGLPFYSGATAGDSILLSMSSSGGSLEEFFRRLSLQRNIPADRVMLG